MQLILLSDVLKHLKEQPSIAPEDFLKLDYVSNPNFKENPTIEAQRNQVRFTDKRHRHTVHRSHVGTQKDFISYQSQLNKEKLQRKQDA